jgi:sensor c-di-GMP phosphodiesterase-like protein
MNTSQRAARANADDTDDKLFAHLQYLIERRQLDALLQPIIRMDNGDILGYEGLIRGPLNSPLHLPAQLFSVARAKGPTQGMALEQLCRQVVLQRFAELKLPASCFSMSARNACCCAPTRLCQT